MRGIKYKIMRKIAYIVCLSCMLCASGGCADRQMSAMDTEQTADSSSEEQSEAPSASVLPSDSARKLNQDIPDSPPVLELIAADADGEILHEFSCANYSWNYEIGDGMMSGAEACGPSPLDKDLYKKGTRNVLCIPEEKQQTEIGFEVNFAVMPDSLVVEEWGIDALDAQNEAEAEQTTYDEVPSVLMFDMDRVYQVTASWDMDKQQERGFYGNASYAFMTVEDWRRIYLTCLNEMEYADSFTYTLIYVDEDYIPELIVDRGSCAGGCVILTVHDNVVDELETIRLNFSYIEQGNRLCNSDGNMGFYFDYVYTIRDGKWEYVAGGELGDGPEGIQLDENGNEIFVYWWNEVEVEEEEYYRQLDAVFPREQAINPDEHVMDPREDERYYIASEMRSILLTGDVTSVKHRYELVEGDMTWEEACQACDLRGGYLAAITSWEELEQIKEQIVAEGKEDISFWVGANLERGLKGDSELSWGFHWIDPSAEEAYDMLALFNALYGFWIGDEPSYEGQTEDGRTVKEYCVMLLYRSEDDRCYIMDMPEDILSAFPSYTGKIGYICEYDPA